ncbi:hypothetical protein M758_8G014500 [Ceratodon purpureus]|nr:hypothetical protein M758_8G014500 [Ceratodon purpureus]
MELEEALGKLTDRMQIKREHGVTLLQTVLSNAEPSQRQELLVIVTERVKSLINAQQWESRHGGFCAGKILVLSGQQRAFEDELLSLAALHLEDLEPGVRLAVGECLYALGKVQGISVFNSVKDRLLLSIQNGFDGDLVSGDESDQDGLEESPVKKPPAQQRNSNQALTGAMGSRFLETSIKALQRLMEGCGESFHEHVTSQLWQLLLKALSHTNRFVRETGFLCVSTLCQISPLEVLKDNGGLIASYLALGLSDNWSQVRYAASISTRTFMRRTLEFKSDYFPKLLPAMCLNRYYGAEGLRLYSQETWQLVLGNTGKEEVAKCVDVVLEYYIAQSTAQNHLVKEAACHCMAELLGKIDPERIGSLVPRVLTTLMNSFKDPSWAVRDAACSAMRKAITGYPEEVKMLLPQLYVLWFAHLADNVRNVRENSAFTLGSAMRSFQEAIEKSVVVLQEILPQAKQQVDKPCCCHGSQHFTQCTSAEARLQHGRVSSAEDNMNGTVSAITLPKPVEACDDYGFARESEPWEKSEGGIYLLRELSAVAPDRAAKFLPVLAQLAQSSGYVQYHSLMETLYRLLPSIAQNLGKRTFKPHLELFIDPLFSALTCGQRLSENASGFCVSKLIEFIGPNIFKARLDSKQLAILQSSPLINANSMTRGNAFGNQFNSSVM